MIRRLASCFPPERLAGHAVGDESLDVVQPPGKRKTSAQYYPAIGKVRNQADREVQSGHVGGPAAAHLGKDLTVTGCQEVQLDDHSEAKAL